MDRKDIFSYIGIPLSGALLVFPLQQEEKSWIDRTNLYFQMGSEKVFKMYLRHIIYLELSALAWVHFCNSQL